MRGKKVDREFIFAYIQQNLSEEGTSYNYLINKINDEIGCIDDEIKKVEDLKKRRCKLLDVREFLEKS